MVRNLIKPEWPSLDSTDLRLLLEARIGGPGQYSGALGDDNLLYLPLAGDACRVKLRFKGNKLSAVEPGKRFDPSEWMQVSSEIETTLLSGLQKVGRDISFSSFRVNGWWKGQKSGVQIRSLPRRAPSVPTEIGQHPFVLEFPLKFTSEYRITNERRRREHRHLSLLLNVLLMGGVTIEPLQSGHGWATVGWRRNKPIVKWVQHSYFTNFGKIWQDRLSRPMGTPLEALAPTIYYAARGIDGKCLRVPTDLDESIIRYRDLKPENRERFDRALYWMDIASRQWATSMSASFTSLVSGIESLTDRGVSHSVYCEQCRVQRKHDVPGPTSLFREFLEKYAPGVSLKKRRDEMYQLRSGISHGTMLISFDEGRAHGWDPPWKKQNDLHRELWSITRIALRNWLKNPPSP